MNYWEPWYLGLDPTLARKPGVIAADNPRTGAYKSLFETGHDLQELHALMAPRPFLVSGGSEDTPARWIALNHSIAVNKLLGYDNRVAMTNRPAHQPTVESNEAIYLFFEHFLKDAEMRGPSYRKEAAVLHVCYLAIVLIWLCVWPYKAMAIRFCITYARSVWSEPRVIFGAWSRPMHKALIILPALGGIVPTRMAQALITFVLAWQTVSFAKQVGMPNPLLAAPLLVLQPYVFALASDTMTEIPMALATLIALRLWMSGRIAWSSLIVSFLPLFRPEGFFLIGMWGILLIPAAFPGEAMAPNTSWRREPCDLPQSRPLFHQRLLPLCLLNIGLLAWLAGCWLTTGDFFYFIRVWSWPMESYGVYKAGPIYHYILCWPVYCGVVLTIPFLVGIKASLARPSMRLAWSIWLLVFVLHSLMYWLHKFASAGMIRILACTAPMTALICLEGFNQIGRSLARRGFVAATRQRLAVGAMIVAILWSMIFYALLGEHYHCFGYQHLIAEAQSHRHS